MYYRYSPEACLAFAKSFYVAEDRNKLVLTPQIYASPPQTVLAGTQAQILIPISNQADFILCGINLYSPTTFNDSFISGTILFVDSSSGEPLSQGPQPMMTYYATGLKSHSLPHPYFLRGNSALSASVNNGSVGDILNFTIVLTGYQCRVLG